MSTSSSFEHPFSASYISIKGKRPFDGVEFHFLSSRYQRCLEAKI